MCLKVDKLIYLLRNQNFKQDILYTTPLVSFIFMCSPGGFHQLILKQLYKTYMKILPKDLTQFEAKQCILYISSFFPIPSFITFASVQGGNSVFHCWESTSILGAYLINAHEMNAVFFLHLLLYTVYPLRIMPTEQALLKRGA